MSNIDKQALRQLATRATPGPWEEENGEVWIMRNGTATSILTGVCGDDTSGQQDFDNARLIAAANPEALLALLDELEAMHKYAKDRDAENEGLMLTVGRLRVERDAAEKRIAELEESHSKLRDTIAAIHNTIRMDGGYTPLAAILNAAKRAHEESASAAGIGVKGE